jgi:7-cyano-7-deazaguanine synthase
MSATLLCFSGGLDSVTLAAKLKKDGCEIAGLFIDRGQSNVERERESVDYFAKLLKMPVLNTSIRDWRASWRKADGVQDKEVPRNALFVLAALPFALERRAGTIALGSNQDDTAVPDGSPEFVSAMNHLLEVTKQPVSLIAPFLDRTMGKSAVAEMALDLLGEEGIAKTWTCWSGGLQPCRVCLACRTRDRALVEARQRRQAGAKAF